MARKSDHDGLRLDEAARAGWLYYVAGNTQDEIARKLGISRQAAQRLVSLAISERLIKVRLDHPIARCMELAAALKLRYDLRFCEVAPTDPASTSSTLGIAQAAAAEFERWLRRSEPAIIGIGTGRTMRAVADQLPAMECPQHKLVALVGTTKTDGSASFYDVIIRVSDSVRAPHYPMPLPVIARSVEERELLTSLASVKSLFDLAERTDVSFVGVGAVGELGCFGAGWHHHPPGSGSFAPAGRGWGDHGLGVRFGGKSAHGGDEPAGRLGAVATRRQPACDRRRDGAVEARASARRARRSAHFRPGHGRIDRGASAAAVTPHQNSPEISYICAPNAVPLGSVAKISIDSRPKLWRIFARYLGKCPYGHAAPEETL